MQFQTADFQQDAQDMMQAATQIRKWWAEAMPALTWARAHTRLAMGATLFLVAAVWVAEHDARVEREVELGVMRREISSEVSGLRRKAEGAIQESRASESVIRDLEARRAGLEREASVLRARLKFLHEEERVPVRPAGTPGHNVLAGRAQSRPDPARSATAADAAQSQISDLRFQSQRPESSTRPPDIAAAPGPIGIPSPLDGAPGYFPPPFDARGTSPDGPAADPAADSCHEQSKVQDQLIANCEERAELSRTALEAAKRSTLQLGEALRAKDAIAARLEEQYRVELKAARGSRLRRFGRALQYVGVGVVIGMAAAL